MDRFQEEFCLSGRSRLGCDEDGFPDDESKVELEDSHVEEDEEPCSIIRGIFSLAAHTTVREMVEAANSHRAGDCSICNGIRKPIEILLALPGRAA